MEKPLYTCARERIMCVLHLYVFVYMHAHVLVQAYMCHGSWQLWMSILPFPLFEIVLVFCHGMCQAN